MPIEDLAMCILDRLASTPTDRVAELMSSHTFMWHHVNEAYGARMRELRPAEAFAFQAEDAVRAFPDYAKALTEAWAFLESRSYLVPVAGHPNLRTISSLGHKRHEQYRGAVVSRRPPVVGHPATPEKPTGSGMPDLHPEQPPPKVAILWAHDDPEWTRKQAREWEGQIYAFATLLREMEIDADLDLFHSSEPTDWARFGQRAIRESDHVLVAVSRTWRRAWDGDLEPGNSSGTVAETNHLRGVFQRDPDEFLRRVILVTLPGVSTDEIPEELRATSHWSRVPALDEAGVEDLYRRLTGQPAYPKPPLGQRRTLGPRYPVLRDDELAADVQAIDDALASLPSKADAGTSEARAHNSLTKRREALVADHHQQVVRAQFDPAVLRGRVFPNQFAASVSASEKVLAVRAAIAAQLPEDPVPMIDSADEQAFTDLVVGSFLEAWATEMTSRSEGWRSIDPTSSSVVTLRRPPAPSVVDSWEVECRAFITVTPDHSLRPAGHGILVIDVLFRPTGDEPRSKILTIRDLFGLLFVLPPVLVDQIGMDLFDRLGRGVASSVLSATVVVQSYGLPLGAFVELQKEGWNRAEGSYDRHGADWEPTDRAEWASPERRADAIRQWVKRLLRDSGIRGHEAEIENLPIPELPKL